MKPSDPSGITVELIGGLGNQLFQYATGLAQTRRLECPLTLDITHYEISSKRVFALDSFAFEGTTARDPKPPNNRASRLLRKRVPTTRERSFQYDPLVTLVPVGTRLEGYFQSWRYFETIATDLRQQIRTLRRPSPWFIDKREELGRKPWIGVHVRRGDYATDRYKDTFGPVSLNYVATGLQHVRMCSSDLPVVVFTDDPASVRQELTRAGMTDLVESVVNPPPQADALESLLLLSEASHLVLSNSSFSWWAGYLGDRAGRLVVAPRPWFLGLGHDTRDLLLPHWLTLDSRAPVTSVSDNPGETGTE